MNESTSLDLQTSGAGSAPLARKLPRLRFPAVFLLIFWALSFIAAAIDKPYFVGFMYTLASTALVTLLFLGWWWFNRSLRLSEKCAGFAVLVVEAWVVGRFSHRSITFFTVWLVGLPIVASLIIAWLFAVKQFRFRWARTGFALVVTLGWSYLLLIRFDGADSTLKSKSHLRWTPTAEEQFLAKANLRSSTPAAPASKTLTIAGSAAPDWTDFRGPNRDGVISGCVITTNWSEHPPVLIWKHPVGPAWSSLLLVSNQVYTQEQRGEKETVVCYDALSGDQVWIHEDTARFEESVSGAGPRATPTFANGRLYSLGGT